MMHSPITTKEKFYRLWDAGLLGNRLNTWEGPIQYLGERGYSKTDLLVIRDKNPSGYCKYDIRTDHLIREWVNAVNQGCDPVLNEAMDPSRVLLNAEARYIAEHGFTLTYSLERLHMRPAIAKAARHAIGTKAMAIVRHFLDGNSQDDLFGLFERYPDHVIEFTALDKYVGILPRRNTLIWEVRFF